jgi:predicted nucleic acid-binding protein
MQQRHDELITGAFTFGEVLAGAYRQGSQSLAEDTSRLLKEVVSQVVPFTLDTADQYARIRGSLRVPPADAIHLACAAHARADLFLTNDQSLIGKFVPGIQFIAGLDTPLF